eukprot:6700273-Pyramimonas_sp.AAC.2
MYLTYTTCTTPGTLLVEQKRLLRETDATHSMKGRLIPGHMRTVINREQVQPASKINNTKENPSSSRAV